MKSVIRSIATATAFTVALAAAPSLFAMTPITPQDRDDHIVRRDSDDRAVRQRDYSHDRYYTLGNREGYHDYRRHVNTRKHHHRFRDDDERHAHDFGYQQGLQGRRGYRTEYGTYNPNDPR